LNTTEGFVKKNYYRNIKISSATIHSFKNKLGHLQQNYIIINSFAMTKHCNRNSRIPKKHASSQYCNASLSTRNVDKVQTDLNKGIKLIDSGSKQESFPISSFGKQNGNEQNGFKQHYECHLDASKLPREPINIANKMKKTRHKIVRSHIMDFLPPTWSSSQHKKPQQQENARNREKYQYRSRRHNRSVKFNNDITVLPIKSYRDYPISIRRSMWNSLDEIRQNARRNVIEYRAEGNDWRQATEEDRMWYDVSGRDYIHPAHIPLFLRQYQYYVQYRYIK